MNITFFIGNGFDLALDLKTRYLDFYKAYEEKKYSNIENGFAKAYIKTFSKDESLLLKIISDPNMKTNWADFESKLCLEYINSITTKEQEERFIKDFYEFKDEFSSYLEIQSNIILQDESVTKDGNRIHDITTRSICRFYEYLSESNKTLLKKYFDEKPFVYNIVSFNYTKTIDFILSKTKRINSKYEPGLFFTEGKIIDVHGTYDESLITGFGEIEKIQNKSILENDEIKNAIIKLEHNKVIGKMVTEKVCNLIDESDIIVIFGMSLGISDSNWWKKIIEKSKNSNMPIVYYYYHDIKPLENSRFGSEISRLKEKLSKDIDADEETRKFIDEMFIVDMEKRIFNFDK